jgi:hypothetical protein
MIDWIKTAQELAAIAAAIFATVASGAPWISTQLLLASGGM